MSAPIGFDTIDGNEAVASVAYRLSEVCAIYPITPSSSMAELSDQWSAEGRQNVWGNVPTVIEMQSEGGAAGVVHGALQTGALTTTFTSSQGLLLMIPNMFKIAGELTPAVLHVAARAIATHALSIFGDHSDIMAVRATGFSMLGSASVQEAHDMAAIAHAATLETRVPFIHFFDGFRTSHEVAKLRVLTDDDLRALVDVAPVLDHRRRGLSPERPVVRGTAQNPDVFFQSREAGNLFHARVPDAVDGAMQRFAAITGRAYRPFELVGDPAAERVIVAMGSACETAREVVRALNERGERVALLQVRLFRPFDAKRLLAALPGTARAIAVLDRTKEPGALGEPLYADVMLALAEEEPRRSTRVIGGRYGLGSKELTPAMLKAVFDELGKPTPKNHFTLGIEDDVSNTSLAWDPAFSLESPRVVRAVFFGLGSDGTVGANKNSIKIIGEGEGHAQGYFVYDSKKSGSQTVSHLRFGPDPIHSAYLVEKASFVACHQWGLLDRTDVLDRAEEGATFLVDAPFPPGEVWKALPEQVRGAIREKRLELYAIDASDVAKRAGLGGHKSTIMQACFFAISKVLPREEAIAKIRASVKKSYSKKGSDVVERNFTAIDLALASLHRIEIPPPEGQPARHVRLPLVPDHAPRFVREVTATMMEGRGDALPVSAMPVDGTYPSGTARWEKRNVSTTVPAWDPDICIQCGNCALVCPHAVIRAKFYDEAELEKAPPQFPSAPIDARGFPDIRYSLQVYVEDCTGCALCFEACPARALDDASRRALAMVDKTSLLETQRENIAFFESLPWNDRGRVDFSTVRGAQFLEPHFEFPGACAGCGETPYLKLASQLFGDRMVIANATGCSSIYGGNLPTTPWTAGSEGRGPAWSNSLFEDNAEFGLGFRLAADAHLAIAQRLARELAGPIGEELVESILNAPQRRESELRAQRARVGELTKRLQSNEDPRARELLSVADHLVRRSVWCIGGDGWAYDIGAGGLDHVLASGRDINVLVLDTEVYSNTGGQASKATPLGAVAKFSAAGKPIGKKDLALQAISYGNVYVARVAFGANPQQTLLALREAEAYSGPSLIIAYSHCIAHGIPMEKGLDQQARAVSSGYWPLIRYNPAARASGENPFALDSGAPRTRFRDYAYRELRYRMLAHTHPERAEQLMKQAEEAVRARLSTYERMARGAS